MGFSYTVNDSCFFRLQNIAIKVLTGAKSDDTG